ncbi:MAG: ERCC4 domain-containing protein, partial [Promethearchaeota archaeon]
MEKEKSSRAGGSSFLFVVADDRERVVARLLGEYPVEVVRQRLDVADFLISGELAVERKRGDDLVASIMDNRLWDELERLKGTFGSPVLVVEELERAFER